MRAILLVLGSLLASSACLARPAPERARGPLPAGQLPSPGAPEVVPARGPGAARREPGLTLWDDPAFQRQIVESYLAETEIEPRVTAQERDELQAVLALVSEYRMDEAARRLEGLRGPEANALFDFTRANVHLQREELDAAARAYQIAVDKFPKFRRAWKNLALVHVRRSDFGAARGALTRVLEQGGGDALTYGLLGFANSNRGEHLAAESAYRAANLLDPETLDWKLGLARSLFEQQRFADAAALCGSLIAENRERPDLWLLQANAYLGLGQPMKAAENYELVERLGASTIESLSMLGDIYVNAGLHELAVRCYVVALERDPEAPVERALRAAKAMTAGGALEETGLLVERIRALRGERLATEERKVLLQLGARLAMARGAGDEEARLLEAIVALDPLDGEALILLGQHAGRTGDPEKAAFYYERAASLEAFEADAKVRHGQLLVSQGRYGEALPLLRRAQTLKPRENVQRYMEQVERAAQAR